MDKAQTRNRLPRLVSQFHDRLDRSVFRSLGASIATLADQYGAYLDDFERHLRLLREAFPEKPWPDWAADGYIRLNKLILREEMSFSATGQYSASPGDVQRITEEVYDNSDVMERYYLVGLYCTYFLWPHHYRILQFYRRRFLGSGSASQHLMEWGVGHGLLTLEALLRWNRTEATVLDLSDYSLSFSERLLQAGDLWSRCHKHRGDVLQEADLPQVDRIICSELLEHVPDPGALLERLRASLAPKGLAFLTGAINAPQPDHVFLFTSSQQLLKMVSEYGFTVKSHLSTCHPSREGRSKAPTVLAMVVERAS